MGNSTSFSKTWKCTAACSARCMVKTEYDTAGPTDCFFGLFSNSPKYWVSIDDIVKHQCDECLKQLRITLIDNKKICYSNCEKAKLLIESIKLAEWWC